MTTNKNAILVILGDRPVAYHPILAKALGNVEAAVWVSQLLYWTGKEADPEGWIYKTQAEWEEETGLSRRNQETARRNLGTEKGLGVLEETLKQMPARLHYRLDLEKLADILSEVLDRSPVCANRTNRASQFARTVQTSMAEPAKQSIYTESTTSSSSNGHSPEKTGPKKPDMNNLPLPPGLGEINTLWLNNIGAIGPIQADQIAALYDDYGGFEMEYAIHAAVNGNARSMNYVQGTLKGRRNGSTNHPSQQTARNGSSRPAKTNGSGRATQPTLSDEDARLMAEWAAANT